MIHDEEFLDAVRAGDAAGVAARLREHPALARAAGEHAKTALHWAAELDHVDVARLLLDAGADAGARTSWGATPFEWAAWMGAGRVADLLLSRGAGRLTLVTAAALGRLDAVRAILDSGADLAAHRRTDAPREPDGTWPPDSAHIRGDVLSDALHAAARNGHAAVVEDLLDRGADINARGVFGGTGLHWAALNGHAAMVDVLLARGADTTLADARFGATAEAWAGEGGRLPESTRRRLRVE